MVKNRVGRVATRLTALTLSALLLLTSAPMVGAATLAEKLQPNSDYGVSFDYIVDDNYRSVLAEYAEKGYTAAIGTSVSVAGGDATAEGKITTVSDGKYTNALSWEEELTRVTWSFDVPVDGLYAVRVAYKAKDNSTQEMVRSMMVDGELPFAECGSFVFRRMWVDDLAEGTDITKITQRPKVKQLLEWQETYLYDNTRMYNEPLQFYLTAGKHTIAMDVISGDMLIGEIALEGITSIPNYQEVSAGYTAYSAGKDRYVFEAETENILFKNSNIIRMMNTGDPTASPYNVRETVMNIIGDSAWSDGGMAITWQIEVETDGLYQLAFHVKQNFRDGLPSYRRIEIDGKVPFEEMLCYKFVNQDKWRVETLSSEEGTPYQFYLTAGKHTLTMSVVQGAFGDILELVKTPSGHISDLLLRIKMIVGQNPDANYDYELEDKIPTLMDELDQIESEMGELRDSLVNVSDKKVAMFHQIESMLTQIDAMIDNPFIIPRHLSDFEEMLTTFGNWQTSFTIHPLTLDTIELYPAGESATVRKTSFFKKVWVTIVGFFISFTKDYNDINNYLDESVEVKSTLDVWVSYGTDWANLIKQMADEQFTTDTGIQINMNILPSGQLSAGGVNALMLAIASGNAPDVCLGTTATSVGEFALRNTLLDLTQFEDFEEVRKQFIDSIFIPLTVGDKVYGLPETMSFMVTAYRKDILSQLGLSVPNTWDELYQKVIPVLSQNNMEFYTPSTYPIFLYQMGGSNFTEDLMYSALDTPQAYAAFKELCELYTLYGVPVAANFYNRFRAGEMPIGVVDYVTYMQLRCAANDLDGKWGISLIPGHMREDGTVDHTHNGLASNALVAMQQTQKPDECWEFVKWWMSTEVQSQYGFEIESLKGESSRWNTANVEAFAQMSWDINDKPVIMDSLDDFDTAPVVLGGYFDTRHINNAFVRVVTEGMDPRDSLEQAVKDINAELRRRRESQATVK